MKKELTQLSKNMGAHPGQTVQFEGRHLIGRIDDDGAYLLVDCPSEEVVNAMMGQDPCVFQYEGFLGSSATIVTGPPQKAGLSRLVSGDLDAIRMGARIRYAIMNAPIGDLDNIELDAVRVETSFVGRRRPVIRFPDGEEEWWQGLFAGRKSEIWIDDAQTFSHGDWHNHAVVKVGDGSLSFSTMETVMPGADMQARNGDAGIVCAAIMVQSLRVLLALLNGGGDALAVNSIKLDCLQEGGGTFTLSFSCPALLRNFHVLPFGASGTGWFRDRLKVPNGIAQVGMKKIKQWVDWCSMHENQDVLNCWLHNERPAAALVALEGLGRMVYRQDPNRRRGKVQFERAVQCLLDEYGLGNEMLPAQARKDMYLAHNDLTKHIGGGVSKAVRDRRLADMRRWSVFADFLVAYGLLRCGLGELPEDMDAAWRSELEKQSPAI